MIYDVLETCHLLVTDETVGINAQISIVDAKKGTTTKPMEEFLTWDLSKLPTQMRLPSLQVVWERTPVWQMRSQNKWRLTHTISWNAWFKETGSGGPIEQRKAMAIVAHAMALTLEEITTFDGSNVEELVPDPQFNVAGWVVAGKIYSYVGLTFEAKELDEDP